MTTRSRRLLAAVLAVLLGVLGVAVTAAPANAAPADDIASLVNQARWQNGQAGLIRNPAMDQVAANWAAQLAASGTLSHNPNYSTQIPAGWRSAGENVAQGQPTGAAMHDAWMNSPGHRANVLGDFTDIGIAFLTAGGTTWGVEVFAKYPGHAGPSAPAPAPPAAAPAPAPAPEQSAEATPTPTAEPEATPTPTADPEPSPTATAGTTRSDDRDGARDDRLASAVSPVDTRGGWLLPALLGAIALAAGAAASIGLLARRRRVAATPLDR